MQAAVFAGADGRCESDDVGRQGVALHHSHYMECLARMIVFAASAHDRAVDKHIWCDDVLPHEIY